MWLVEERHQLPLFIPVMLGAGIALWFGLGGADRWLAAIAACLAAAFCGLLLSGLLRRVVAAGALLVAAGVALAWWHAASAAAPVLEETRFGIPMSGVVLEIEEQQARGRTRLLISPRSMLPAEMTVRVSIRGELPDIAPGALVRMRATLNPPPGPSVPGGYHFARRAWFEGIGATGYALGEPELLAKAPDSSGFSAWLQDLRRNLTRRLQEGVGGREGGVAAALVTGDRGGIPPEVTEAMRDSGLAHLIAISGLHIAVVVGGTLWLTRRLLVRWTWFALRYDARIAAASAAALAGIAYTLIAGAGVPTVRACIAVLIVLIGLVAGREAISLRLVAVGATAILVWRPDYLLSPSFQLSFAAVTGIVALYQSPLGRRWSEADPTRGRISRLSRSIVALFLTGIVAELTIGPVALYHFNQMGLYGAAANLIAIPLTSFAIIPQLIGAVLAEPLGLAAIFHAGLSLAIGLLIELAEATASLPGAVAFAPAMPTAAFLLIVAGGLWICLWQTRRRWAGVLPVVAGLLASTLAPRPDLLVGPNGKHLAVADAGGLAMLRPRAGSFISEMWSGAAGADRMRPLETLPGARCSADSCMLTLQKGGREWRILATRSRALIPQEALAPACAASDIVVSARRLPAWCDPRWLKLDRAALAELGGVSIDLDRGTLRSSAAEDAEHPWAR